MVTRASLWTHRAGGADDALSRSADSEATGTGRYRDGELSFTELPQHVKTFRRF